ncbi:MAG: ATP-binding protein [Deltaproteobacteria bacterium]|nr:ATP-binding protein [Deltaproteobacteria bacterium]
MATYFERDFASTILSALKNMPVVAITGLRQTGKTTFLQHQFLSETRRFISFDDFAQLSAAKSDPDHFVNSDEPLTIDEAHKCPEIFTSIKRMVDRKRKLGQFLLSGSANFTMLRGITETLAGRAIYFQMHPFSRREIGRGAGEQPFLKRFFETLQIPKHKEFKPIEPEDILKGGMPTVCLGDVEDRTFWFKGYEQTYLERDIRQISQIENIVAYRNLLHLVGLRTGQILNVSQLGRDAKLTSTMTSRYISLLETSYVISKLNPYLRNRASRLIKSPKVYISDSGLACFMVGVDSFSMDYQEPLLGALFETYVAQNLFAILSARWKEAQLYFWSIQGRNEVDFIIEVGRNCLAVEVKSSGRWQKKDFSGLEAFLATTPHCVAAVLCYNGTEAVRLGEKLWALPLGLILS